MAVSTHHRGQQTDEGELGAYILLGCYCVIKQGRLNIKYGRKRRTGAGRDEWKRLEGGRI
jgi:hypothetical protein